jgi:hypothetical protein
MARLTPYDLDVGDRVYDTISGHLWTVVEVGKTVLLQEPTEEEGFEYFWRVNPDRTNVTFIREGDVDG